MQCSDYQDWMMQQLDGELPEEQWEDLCRHMSECRLCSEEWRQIRFTVESLRQLPMAAVPENLLERTMQRIYDLQEQQPRPDQRQSFKRVARFQPLWMGTAAACLVIFLFSSWWTVAGISSSGMGMTYVGQGAANSSALESQPEVMMQEKSEPSEAGQQRRNASELEEEMSIMSFEPQDSHRSEADSSSSAGDAATAAPSHSQTAPPEMDDRSWVQSIGWPYRLLMGAIALGLGIFAFRKSAAAE